MSDRSIKTKTFSEPTTLAKFLKELSKFRENKPNIRVHKGMLIFDSECLELHQVYDLFEHLEDDVHSVQEIHFNGNIIIEIFII